MQAAMNLRFHGCGGIGLPLREPDSTLTNAVLAGLFVAKQGNHDQGSIALESVHISWLPANADAPVSESPQAKEFLYNNQQIKHAISMFPGSAAQVLGSGFPTLPLHAGNCMMWCTFWNHIENDQGKGFGEIFSGKGISLLPVTVPVFDMLMRVKAELLRGEPLVPGEGIGRMYKETGSDGSNVRRQLHAVEACITLGSIQVSIRLNYHEEGTASGSNQVDISPHVGEMEMEILRVRKTTWSSNSNFVGELFYFPTSAHIPSSCTKTNKYSSCRYHQEGGP
jgi:hypothetical protein